MVSLVVISGCWGEPTPVQEKGTLTEARRGFKSKLVAGPSQAGPVPEPPPEIFRKVLYESPAGKLQAYLSQVPDDGQKRPAIIWITGGDSNSIDDVWTEVPSDNDQTASAYRKAGIVLMFPSLRGGNDNPGIKEAFLGEVDDILAAAVYLARQESVDSSRIYLGGHSTGGTLVLLVAECYRQVPRRLFLRPGERRQQLLWRVHPLRHVQSPRSGPPVPWSVAELDQEPDLHHRGDRRKPRIAASHAALIDQPAGPLPARARCKPLQRPRPREPAHCAQDSRGQGPDVQLDPD